MINIWVSTLIKKILRDWICKWIEENEIAWEKITKSVSTLSQMKSLHLNRDVLKNAVECISCFKTLEEQFTQFITESDRLDNLQVGKKCEVKYNWVELYFWKMSRSRLISLPVHLLTLCTPLNNVQEVPRCLVASSFVLLAIYRQKASTAVFLGWCVKSSCLQRVKLVLSSWEQFISNSQKNLLYSFLMLPHQEQLTDLLCKKKKKDGKFSHSALLPQKEEKLNLIMVSVIMLG